MYCHVLQWTATFTFSSGLSKNFYVYLPSCIVFVFTFSSGLSKNFSVYLLSDRRNTLLAGRGWMVMVDDGRWVVVRWRMCVYVYAQEHEGRCGSWRGGMATCHLSMSKAPPSWHSPPCPPLPLRVLVVLVALAVGGAFSSPAKGITAPGVVGYVERMFVGRSGEVQG